MLRAGGSLDTIATVLRHQSPGCVPLSVDFRAA